MTATTIQSFQLAVAHNAFTFALTPYDTYSPSSKYFAKHFPHLPKSSPLQIIALVTSSMDETTLTKRAQPFTLPQYVSQVAAYRLIFLDSNSVFYGGLYIHNVEDSCIRPALRILKQNLSLLTAIVIDPLQPLAIKEAMKAAFEVFLMVLLAGGGTRVFKLTDHKMIEEDFDHLKKAFTLGEGLVADEVVEGSDTVESVLELMGESTTKLVHDFSTVACQTSGVGSIAAGQKLPMPPTTGKWQREDGNTILRDLCHRNDRYW